MNLEQIAVPAALFIAILGTMLKYILWQNEKRMDFRFSQLEAARQEASAHWDRRYGETESAVMRLSERIIRVEANQQHMPTHIEMQKINNDLGQIRGETNTQTALLQRMEKQMTLINEWMMENK